MIDYFCSCSASLRVFIGISCQPKCNPHYLLGSAWQPKCHFHGSDVHISYTTNPCWMCRFSLKLCNVLSLQGGLLAGLTLWALKGICPGLWRAKFSQVLKGLKMPLKQHTLEQHQSAKPSQFKYISPKDLAQLNKKNILYQITFRIHTSPVPLGIWSFTVAILTE